MLVADGRRPWLAARILAAPLRRALAGARATDSLRRGLGGLALNQLVVPADLARDLDTLGDIAAVGAEPPASAAGRSIEMSQNAPEGLAEWVEAVAPELGIAPEDVPIDLLLAMTGQVAHGVVRPAAPVTAFALGLALGRGAVSSSAEGEALIRKSLLQWQAEHSPAAEAETR